MSIKNIKSIHKIGEKFEVKNPFIKVPCDNHEFEITSVANNIDVKISKNSTTMYCNSIFSL